MRNLIAAFLAFFALSASAAEMVAKNGDEVIRLQDRPCVHAGTLAQIKPEFRERFRMARATLQGRQWFACFIVTPKGDVHLVFEDGDELELPTRAFKADPGV